MVTGWRSPADGVAGLGGLTVQAHCLSGYSHYPPPQPPAQLSPNQRVILWLALENGNGARARSCCWRDIPTCTLRSLVWSLLLFCNIRLRIMVVRTRVSSGEIMVVRTRVSSGELWLLEHVCLRVNYGC